MGHSEDDAVHKIPHKVKMHWQSQLKISVLIWFNILYRIRYKKIDVTLVQCPFNIDSNPNPKPNPNPNREPKANPNSVRLANLFRIRTRER